MTHSDHLPPGVHQPPSLLERLARRLRSDGPEKPRKRPWTVTQVVVLTALVACAVGTGVWTTLIWDLFRLSFLDGRQAYEVGYTAEIDSWDLPIHPRGLTGGHLWLILLASMLPLIPLIPWATHLRRRSGDPAPWLLPVGTALLAAVVGGLWISTDWRTPTEQDWTLAESIVRASGVWIPALFTIAGLTLLGFWAWLRRADASSAP